MVILSLACLGMLAGRISGWAFAPSPGEGLPVRWNTAKYPWITSIEDCRRLWNEHPVGGGPDPDPLFLQRGPDDRTGIEIQTCAELRAAIDQGYYAVSMRSERHLASWVFADGILATLAAMRPSVRSAFVGIDLAAEAHRLLPARMVRHELRRDPDYRSEWTMVDGAIRRAEANERDGCWEVLTPVAFGDIDGDGWEDMLATWYFGFNQAMGRRYEVVAFACRGDGRFVDISDRTNGGTLTEAEIRDRHRDFHGNLGLPEDRALSLTGTCDCGDDPGRRPHACSLTFRLTHGYAEGHYACDMRPIRSTIAGVFTEWGVRLHEYGLDRAPTACHKFRWKIDADVLELEGYCFEAGFSEVDDITLRGSVGAPAQADPKAQSR